MKKIAIVLILLQAVCFAEIDYSVEQDEFRIGYSVEQDEFSKVKWGHS